MLSHANLLAAAEGFVAAEDIRPSDDILCYLPMAWIGESLFSLVLTLLVGFTCNCPERPETVQRDLRELGPTVALAPPRIWENTLTQLRVRAADATPLKRRTFELFRGLAERAGAAADAGRPVSPLQRVALALGEVLVYGPVRDQLGLAPRPLGLYRRRAARRGHLPLFPLVRDQPEAGLGLDRAVGAGLACSATARPIPTPSARPSPAPRSASPMTARCWSAPPLCSAATTRSPTATRRRGRRRGLVPHRRLRLYRSARPSRRRRSRQRCRQAGGRHPLCPAIRREQAQIQPLHRRGGGLWRPPGVRRGDRSRSISAPSATGPSGATSPIPRSRI